MSIFDGIGQYTNIYVFSDPQEMGKYISELVPLTLEEAVLNNV